MPDELLITGQLLLPDLAGGIARACRLVPGGVRIVGERIAEVFALQGGRRDDQAIDLGGHGAVVMPGLIDAHAHLPQFDSIGAAGMPLLQWLERVVFPAEARWADAAFAGAMGARAAERMLSHGTVGVAAYGSVHAEGTARAMAALAARGMRGYVGPALMDCGAPAGLCLPVAAQLDACAALKPVGRVEPSVNPRFALSCSPELLEGAGKLAEKTGRRVQTHLSETREEVAEVAARFGGLGYVEVYRRCGLVRPGGLFAHGVYLSDEERSGLARSGALVAHCPTANTFLRSGAMDRWALVAQAAEAAGTKAQGATGAPLALGSDVAGGPDVSMVRVGRAMIETAGMLHPRDPARVPTPAQAWWQVTAGNASALGWEDSGRLEAGAWADVVVARPGRGGENGRSATWWMESVDPLGALMFGWDDRWVEKVVVRGRVEWSAH